MRGSSRGAVLVTGASGQIGSRLLSLLRAAGHDVVGTSLEETSPAGSVRCDVRSREEVARVFDSTRVRSVVHLAAVLPTAFRADPIAAAEVNLTGTLNVLREALARGVQRFVFGSSMSVYGGSQTDGLLREADPTAPDDAYGAAKRAVELVGECLATTGFGFVALRIARVVGPGATSPTSRWRSEMFEDAPPGDPREIVIPFAPSSRLSVVHVDEVSRMLQLLVESPTLLRPIYNGPAETFETQRLAQLVHQARGVPVRTGDADGGPAPDVALFAGELGFALRGLADYLSPAPNAKNVTS